MQFLNVDQEHGVSGVSRTGSSGSYRLSWNSVGLNAFLVVSGRNMESLLLSPEKGNHLSDLLEEEEYRISSQGSVDFMEEHVEVRVVEFSKMKQQGGFPIPERPRAYAVYGLEYEGEECRIYIPSGHNTFRFSVEVNLEDMPVRGEKGLFRKTPYYTGYHRIRLTKEIPDMEEGTVFYTVDSQPFRYPVPAEIMNKGGSFYIRCPENARIDFSSGNNSGVRIFVQKKN